MEFRFIDTPAVKAAAIPALFAQAGLEYRSVETLNWKDRFPYLPATSFALAWCRDGLMLHWKVTEDDVLAGVGEDLGHIWEDSCVEFFFAPAGDGIYYNFECNCIGKLYLGAGPGRADRQLATPEVLASIDRSTLFVKENDKKPIIFDIKDGYMKLFIESTIGSMEEDLDIDKEGKDIMIGFNPKFMIDALRAVDEENVTIYMVNPKAPCFIRNEEEDYVYIILPVNFIR